MRQPLIVAIDGPSGSGKSTVARALAKRLGVPYLDTGAMYRAVGLAAKERGIRLPIENPDEIVRMAATLSLDVILTPDSTRVSLDGRDVSRQIRKPEISLFASAVSALPGVRRVLVAEQRRLAAQRGGVLEGRDIGTKVFPETPYKFFLTAPASVRAERRARELEERGTPQPYAEVLSEMERRDESDRTRKDSPLTRDSRYLVIDSADKSPAQVVAEMERLIRPGPPSG